MRKKKGAVSENRRQRYLNLRFIDRLGDLARHVTQSQSHERAAQTRLKELTESVCHALASTHDASKKNLEQHDRRPVVEKTFSLDDDSETLRDRQLLEDREH